MGVVAMLESGVVGTVNDVDAEFRGTVTQKNPVKDYTHGRRFFCRIVPLDDQDHDEYMCMFFESHFDAFDTGDLIAFDAKVSPSRKPGDPTWYTISDEKEVINLGRGQVKQETMQFDVRYVGWPHDRGTRPASSFCYVRAGAELNWGLEIPATVLESFFTGLEVDEEAQQQSIVVGPGLYGVLMVSKKATAVDVKRGFRKLARKWHPDVYDGPDVDRAEEMFKQINEAYGILGDVVERERYNAMLKMTGEDRKEFAAPRFQVSSQGYMPPERCGSIEAIVDKLGSVWRARKILRWDAIVESFIVTVKTDGVVFCDWGIEVPGVDFSRSNPSLGQWPGFYRRQGQRNYGSFSVENDKLPFQSMKGDWSRLVPGTLEIPVRARLYGMYDRARQKPVELWEVEEVTAVARYSFHGDTGGNPHSLFQALFGP